MSHKDTFADASEVKYGFSFPPSGRCMKRETIIIFQNFIDVFGLPLPAVEEQSRFKEEKQLTKNIKLIYILFISKRSRNEASLFKRETQNFFVPKRPISDCSYLKRPKIININIETNGSS